MSKDRVVTSDYMKCLTTNYDNYLKCYFDVSQLEPRSIAFASEDPEFRDKIYLSKKDAYIELGGITFPEEFTKIYKECGFTFDEEKKEWVGGNYKEVKAKAQEPLPGLPKGLRGVGKVGLISLIYG